MEQEAVIVVPAVAVVVVFGRRWQVARLRIGQPTITDGLAKLMVATPAVGRDSRSGCR